jgi:hypothetical protein
VEHYKVGEADCKWVGGLEHHIVDSARKADMVAEVDQLVADMLELEARVQDTAGTRVVVGEKSYSCYYSASEDLKL